MAQAKDRYNIIRQNLIDSGIDEMTAENYTAKILDCKIPETIRFLRTHRQKLLDEVHTNQKRIDCLDFLVYNIEKKEKEIRRK